MCGQEGSGLMLWSRGIWMNNMVKNFLCGASGQVNFGFGIWIESVVKRILDQVCGEEGSD